MFFLSLLKLLLILYMTYSVFAAPWCTSSCCCSGFWFSWLTTFWNSGKLNTVPVPVKCCGSHFFFTSMRIQIWIRIQGPNQSWSDFCVTKRWILAWKIRYRYRFAGTLCRYRYWQYVIKHNYVCKYLQKPFWKAGNQVYLLILVNFLAPGTGSAGSRRPKSMRIHADPDLDPDLKHWSYTYGIVIVGTLCRWLQLAQLAKGKKSRP